MKTLYTSFLLLFVSYSNLFAQPILSQSDLAFQIGDVQVVDSIPFMDMSTETGPNMVWDLNSLITQGTPLTAEVINLSESENASLYPQSTLVRRSTWQGFTVDEFYSTDGNGEQFWGNAFYFGGGSYSDVHSDAELVIPTPMVYNAEGEDIYATELIGAPGATSSSGMIEWSTPGYGTLMVNQETYTDVLMYHAHRLDTTEATFSGFTFYTYIEETVYAFFAAGYHFPIVMFNEITTTDGFEPSATDYYGSFLLSQTSVGLSETEQILPDLKVFPNPTIDKEFFVSFNLEEPEVISFELLDVLGRPVWKAQRWFQSGMIQESFSIGEEVQAGSYLMRIIVDGESQSDLIHIE